MIISNKSYYSFVDSGVLKELEISLKYVLVFIQKEKALNKQREEFTKATKIISKQSEKRGIKEGLRRKAEEMARMMKEKGYPIEEIVQLTGLSKTAVGKIKVD